MAAQDILHPWESPHRQHLPSAHAPRLAGRAGLKARAALCVNCGHGAKHICFASVFDGGIQGSVGLDPPPPLLLLSLSPAPLRHQEVAATVAL